MTLTRLGTLDEDLDLEHDGSVRFVENVLRTVPHGRIAARSTASSCCGSATT